MKRLEITLVPSGLPQEFYEGQVFINLKIDEEYFKVYEDTRFYWDTSLEVPIKVFIGETIYFGTARLEGKYNWGLNTGDLRVFHFSGKSTPETRAKELERELQAKKKIEDAESFTRKLALDFIKKVKGGLK